MLAITSFSTFCHSITSHNFNEDLIRNIIIIFRCEGFAEERMFMVCYIYMVEVGMGGSKWITGR